MFALAVRHGAIPTNPVRDTSRIRKPRRKVVALTDQNLQTVRATIRQWQQPVLGKPGPRHTGDLADIVDLMLATGARIGEILALRWEDLNLAAERPTLTICGTLVFVKGKGFFRQPWTKSDAGYRMITLPRFAVGMLLARKVIAADNPHNAIFASRRGTWLSPNNVRRQWRQARADTDLAWVTPTPSARPWPPSSRKQQTPKTPQHSLGTPAKTSPTRTTSPNPSKHRTSPTSSSGSALTTGGRSHTARRTTHDDEHG